MRLRTLKLQGLRDEFDQSMSPRSQGRRENSIKKEINPDFRERQEERREKQRSLATLKEIKIGTDKWKRMTSGRRRTTFLKD